MNAVEIEQAIYELAEQTYDSLEFPFQFLVAFGNKETTIQKLRKGDSNKSDISNGILQRNHIHIATCETGEVARTLDKLKSSPANAKGKVKFILATDGDELQAEDLTSGETIACDYAKFANYFGFFLPLAGISTVKEIRDNPIDIQATSRLNRLYVELLRTNEDWATTKRRHDMNQFMGRLIFCYFAEDTNIFNGDDLFTKTVEQMSDSKSDNTDYVLKELFKAMDTPFNDRSSSKIPRWAEVMPYVNGGLFSGTRDVPTFTRAARSYLLHAGGLNWKEINPDIFGSMIQAVADDEERGALGMHYTSVPNILKVLNPLFLDDLRKQFDECGDNSRKLLNLKKRISRIRVFDPACGSGNFLVIAYKEMRKIEFKVNQARNETHLKSEIPLNNFRGIELREFPAEIARLAIIIAEFQCDVFYRGQKNALQDFLPLDSKNWIVCGNALHLDWLSICPPTGTVVKHRAEDLFHTPLDQHEIEFENEGGETFICGNPPYKGSNWRTEEQTQELGKIVAGRANSWKSLDYVCAWLLKAANYSEISDSSIAFVTTKSICQGLQASILWPLIYQSNLLINFAYSSFKWSNLASFNAGVIVIVIGLTSSKSKLKKLYEINQVGEQVIREVSNINAYLLNAQDVIVAGVKKALSFEPEITDGSGALDGGHLILTETERKKLINHDNKILPNFIRPYLGSSEFINGGIRWCIWIKDDNLQEIEHIHPISERIQAVKRFRENAGTRAKTAINRPHKFAWINKRKGNQIIIPTVFSESRPFITAGFLPSNFIISNAASIVQTGRLDIFAIISSTMHICWVRAIAGKLGTSLRYTGTTCYNTFPIPNLTEKNKEDLTRCAKAILLAREVHFPDTMADLYYPDKMPENLKAAHDRNDEVLDRIYIGRRFKNDTERLEKLFDLYAKMSSTINTNQRII